MEVWREHGLESWMWWKLGWVAVGVCWRLGLAGGWVRGWYGLGYKLVWGGLEAGLGWCRILAGLV
jgi:hypothetical protein